MKLKTLMDAADDETWFMVVEPGGEEHFFWNADYTGRHPSVMPELQPLLHRTFSDAFTLEYGKDPENPRNKTPVIRVELDGKGKRR